VEERALATASTVVKLAPEPRSGGKKQKPAKADSISRPRTPEKGGGRTYPHML